MYGWLTVVGLVLDIIGVVLLAWDTLPDYRIYRMQRLNELLHDGEFLRELVDHRERPEDPFGSLAFGMRHESSVNSLRTRLGLGLFDPLVPTDSVAGMVAQSKAEIEHAIEREKTKLGKRRRPSLRLGLVLIVFGFLFQLAGQLGSMSPPIPGR
jgi:hypothetical protein